MLIDGYQRSPSFRCVVMSRQKEVCQKDKGCKDSHAKPDHRRSRRPSHHPVVGNLIVYKATEPEEWI